MIINFSVKNFRSIKDKITLSFEATKDKHLEEYYVVEPRKGLRILKMAIIYGANASGKTNVLRALDFLRGIIINPFETKNREFNLQPFKFDSQDPNQPTEFEIEFFHNGVRYFYFVKLNRKAILEERLYFYNPKKALIYNRTTDTGKQLTKIKFGTKLNISRVQHEILEGNTLWNNTVLGGFQKTNIEIKELREVLEWFEFKFLGIFLYKEFPIWEYIPDLDEETKKFVLQFIQQADFAIADLILKKENIKIQGFKEYVEFITPFLKNIKPDLLRNSNGIQVDNIDYEEIEELQTLPLNKIVLYHKVKDNFYPLPLNEESEGTQRAFDLGILLLDILRNNLILPIDELEASLHPDLIKHFLLTFLVNSKEAQLITTTHHRELLMEKSILRHDAIWFTERKEDQSTDLYSLADFDTSVIRKESSVYNFYKAGRLGAVPNLGSYYLNLEYGKEKEK